MLSKERVPGAKNAIVWIQALSRIQRQVNIEIDRKESPCDSVMAQKSSAKPAHTRPLYSCSLISSLRRTSLISSFQNDLIKSEGLKSEIWRWFIYFTLFRQGAKYGRIACSTARFMGFLPRRLRSLVFPLTLANNWNIYEKSQLATSYKFLQDLESMISAGLAKGPFHADQSGVSFWSAKPAKNTSKVLRVNSR